MFFNELYFIVLKNNLFQLKKTITWASSNETPNLNFPGTTKQAVVVLILDISDRMFCW